MGPCPGHVPDAPNQLLLARFTPGTYLVVLARRNEGDLPLWQLVMVEDNKLRMRHPKVRLMSSGRSGPPAER
jgi:hypothetical protein